MTPTHSVRSRAARVVAGACQQTRHEGSQGFGKVGNDVRRNHTGRRVAARRIKASTRQGLAGRVTLTQGRKGGELPYNLTVMTHTQF